MLKEKMEIVERVVVDFESHKDVARAYRVSPSVVSMLLHKIKKNPLLLSELIDRDRPSSIVTVWSQTS